MKIHTVQNMQFIFILSFFVSVCYSISAAQNYDKIILEEILSIGDNEQGEIYQWAGVAVDDSGSIYITDMIDYSIKKYNSRGKFLQKCGRRGNGPGEFSGIRLISAHGDNIYVTDQGNPGIHIFDRNLIYRRRMNYNLPVIDFQALADNRIALSSLHIRELGSVFILDSMGRQIGSIPYLENSTNPVKDIISFEFDDHENIYIAFKFKDIVLKINNKGDESWRTRLLGGVQSKSKNFSGVETPEQIIYKDIALDTAGNIFVLGGSYSKNKSCDIYILTSDGEHAETISLSEPSHCIYIDRQNYLYARGSMGACLKKYKILYH